MGETYCDIVALSSPCFVVTAAPVVAIGNCDVEASTHTNKVVATMLEHTLKACLGFAPKDMM